jgi:iron complex transport system substrate-binding protein
MGQRAQRSLKKTFLSLSIALLIGVLGCDQHTASKPTPATTQAASRPVHPTVASLVPAATDLILGMGAGDQLVAISNYDEPREATRDLPRVGDYQTSDWEKLDQIRPDIMIIYYSPDRMPAGFREHAQALKADLFNIKTERLSDIFDAIDLLGQKLKQPEKAARAKQQLQAKLDAVKQRVAEKAKVPTLVVTSDEGTLACGPDTFLNDLLEIAGGTNVIKNATPRYSQLDREQIAALAPQAVIQLMPKASQPVIDQAMRFWKSLPDLPAVKNHRVCVVTEWYAVQPGYNVGELAEKFEQCLHPSKPSASQTTPSTVQASP